MIRLTLKIQTNEEIHLFNKTTISIGTDPLHADLLLPPISPLPILVDIKKENEEWFVFNLSNDPFIEIEGKPFWKKTLQHRDILSIYDQTILCEFLEQNPTPEIDPLSLTSTDDLSQINEDDFFTLPFEDEIQPFDEIDNPSIQNCTQVFEEMSTDNEHALNSEEKKSGNTRLALEANHKRKSLKDDYLKDLDDDEKEEISTPADLLADSNHLYHAWKWILLFIFSLFGIFAAIGIVVYHSVNDKTEAHAIKAIQATADIAMALTHAQLAQTKSHNQNWSDAEFLKTHLQSILPETSSFASEIDAQGQFNCCPYNLRIYTNNDLSHFLLIAQPAPSLLHWLIPKPIIVVDSEAMEIRLLKEVKHLNRLLTNPDPLEGMNGKEIKTLIYSAEKMSLQSIAEEAKVLDFLPPENLPQHLLGAEYFIYNAPRYYLLGQPLIQKSISLFSLKGNAQEVFSLKQEIEIASHFKHLILYTIQGKLSARQAREGVRLFSPSDSLVFGFISFNENGKIQQARVLSQNDEDDEENLADQILQAAPQGAIDSEIAIQDNLETFVEKSFLNSNSLIDKNHPIYIQLETILNDREQKLIPLFLKLMETLTKEQQVPQLDFDSTIEKMVQHYLNLNTTYKNTLKETLNTLRENYPEITTEQFSNYVNAFHLENLVQDCFFSHVETEFLYQNNALLLHSLDTNSPLVLEYPLRNKIQKDNRNIKLIVDELPYRQKNETIAPLF